MASSLSIQGLCRKLAFIFLVALGSTSVFGQSDVIISQYIETNSGTTPKGIEIFNISGADITFTAGNNLEVRKGTNGGACSQDINITAGTLSADEVWVIGTSDLTGFANTNGTGLSGITTYGFTFNGDDALSLYLGGTIQDMFGICGSDPGSSWSGNGVSTANNNLQIKNGICDGDLNGWTDPSERFDQIADGLTMTGFGNAPALCGPDPEPTNHVTSFACSNPASTTIDLSWTDATGAQTPAGYLILWSTTSFAAITTPTDGTPVADGAGALNVADGIGSATITGLTAGVQHFIKLFSYTNSGSNIDFKTNGTVPQTDLCSTPSPEIQLEYPTGTDVACGTATMDFGAVTYAGGTSSLSFTVSNDDLSVPLSISNMTITGAAAGNYAFLPPPSFPVAVAASGSVTFNVQFTGSAPLGTKAATIDIYSDDVTGSESPCAIDLTGSSFDPQPSEHADNFDCSNPTTSSIELDWEDAGGSILPSGYLILWSSVGYNSITDPIDGITVSDGLGALNVLPGVEFAMPTGLTSNTTFYFKIYSYSGSGASIDYKLDGTIPEVDCTTLDAPCVSESFSNTTSSASYNSITWVGDDGFNWASTQTRTDQTMNGAAITLNRFGVLSHDTQSGGMGVLTFDYRREFSGNSIMEIWVNGIQQGPAIAVSSTANNAFSLVVDIPNTVNLEIRNVSTANSRRFTIDNLSWTCFDGGLCESGIVYSARHPIVGPVGTWVRVNRNTTLSTADFFSLNAINVAGIGVLEIEVIDANILYFKMPAGLSPGVKTISLIDNTGCEETLTFTIENEAGTCGALPTGVFISEVFDPASGNEHYVELYNPLSTAVDLNAVGADYTLRLVPDNNPTSTYDITTNLAGGQTLLLEMGIDGALNCTPGEVTTLVGFNDGGDVIELLFNGSVVDRIVLPNTTGYDRVRRPEIGGPNATYIAGEWFLNNGTPSNADACMHATTTTPWNISSHPVDALSEPCGTATFSLNITGASGQTFLWYENIGGNSSAWTPVTIGGDYSLAGTPVGSQLVVANIQNKEGYQYYCRLTSSGCTQFSHAGRIALAPNTRRYYRSASAGNWTVASNWEFSTNGINGWIAACEYPEWRNADHVLIQNTHTISVNQDLYVPVVEIAVGGVLETLVTTYLEFEETAAGAELIISGTWIDHGDNSNNTLFSNGSTWELSSGGTVVKTNTSSTTTYKDNYETGIANITADAHWYYHHIAADVSTATTSMFYPNLYFSSNSGHNFDGTQELLSGSLTTAVVKGNLEVGIQRPDGSASAAVTVNNRNTNATTILIQGELNIATGSTLTNVHATIPGTGFEVQGNLSIIGTLNLSGGTSLNEGQLLLTGTSIQYGEGAVGNVTNIEANRFEINNSNGAVWTEMDMEVHYKLDLTDGIIDMDDVGLIHLTANALSDIGSQTSFVNGRVRKTSLPAGEFVFPIGDYAGSVHYYQPASLQRPGGTADPSAIYEILYVRLNMNVAPNYPNATYDGNWFYDPPIKSGEDIYNVSTCDFWDIQKLAGGNVRVGLTWTEEPNPADGCTSIVDPDILRIAHFDDGMPGSLDELWEDATASGLCTYTSSGAPAHASGWVYTTDPVMNFSPYTLAQVYDPTQNVLPIQLLSFSAEEKGTAVETEWITASEIDNDFFTVERSLNAIDFEAVGYVTGAGNSTSVRDYSFEDYTPYRGLSYYRLKQTDFNGDFSYSQIEAVVFGIDNAFDIITAYSQDDRMTVEYHTSTSELDLKVYDLLGQVVYQQQIIDQNGRTHINAHLPRGAYLIVLSDGKRQVQRKVFW